MIARSSGINWCWFLEYEIADGKVVIQRHYRLHYGEDVMPTATAGYQIIESPANIPMLYPDGRPMMFRGRPDMRSERIAIAVKINDVQYEVANPQYVYSYAK